MAEGLHLLTRGSLVRKLAGHGGAATAPAGINVYDFLSCSSKWFRIPTEIGDFGHGGSSASFGCFLKYQYLAMNAQHTSSIKQSRIHRWSIPVLTM